MIQKLMLRVEVCTRALRANQNEKKRDACLVCSLYSSGYMGVFSEDVVTTIYEIVYQSFYITCNEVREFLDTIPFCLLLRNYFK